MIYSTDLNPQTWFSLKRMKDLQCLDPQKEIPENLINPSGCQGRWVICRAEDSSSLLHRL